MPHGKSKPRRGQESLGKALHRRRAQDRSVEGSASSYDVDGSKARGKMTSVLEANNLDDFIASAMMSERTFQSHRESTVVVGPDGVEMTLDEDGGMRVEEGRLDGDGADFDFEHMGVPRRPAWNSEMTAEELDALEREAFLEWRRGIASAEESNSNMKVTPFEKNLEVWRQLWRVIERSDLVCQLVDARNPLFYYSTDLETYASKLVPPKPTVVVVNKADYLSSHQQLEWARYFWNRGVTVLFFSARQQQEKLNKEAREGRNIAEGTLPTLSPPDSASLDRFESEDDDVGPENDENEESERDGLATTAGDVGVSGAHGGWRRGEKAVRVLNRLEMCIELERLARTLGVGNPERNGGRACVGMVGYPNVGKSSIINVLVGATPLSHGGVRVRVGATPGKTKHFQTLVLSDTLMLCDCPGLVFPSFVSSTAEMICAGVLPIMQMRNFMPPMTLVARRIPRHILELTYTIKLPILPGDTKGTHGKVILSPQQLLDAFCQARGLFRARALGEPDMPRAARQILKDYTDGRLVFCHPPPELTDEAEARFLKETNKTALKTTKLASKLAAQVGKASAEDTVVARSDAASLQHPENFDLMAEALEQRADAACDIQLDLGIGVGSRSGGSKLTKREMGLKRWGKKDRKVSNKDPYGNEDLESAASFLPIGAKVSAGGKKSRRGKQKDGFTRVTLPHHQTYQGPT